MVPSFLPSSLTWPKNVYQDEPSYSSTDIPKNEIEKFLDDMAAINAKRMRCFLLTSFPPSSLSPPLNFRRLMMTLNA